MMFEGSESISWEELQASLQDINRERTRSIAERIYITCDDPSSSRGTFVSVDPLIFRPARSCARDRLTVSPSHHLIISLSRCLTTSLPPCRSAAVYLAAFIMLLIITSCVSFMLETVEVSHLLVAISHLNTTIYHLIFRATNQPSISHPHTPRTSLAHLLPPSSLSPLSSLSGLH